MVKTNCDRFCSVSLEEFSGQGRGLKGWWFQNVSTQASKISYSAIPGLWSRGRVMAWRQKQPYILHPVIICYEGCRENYGEKKHNIMSQDCQGSGLTTGQLDKYRYMYSASPMYSVHCKIAMYTGHAVLLILLLTYK